MALTVSTNKNWSDYEATSSTSLAITNNAITALSLTIETGKAYVAGDDIALVPTAAKIPMMLIGTVTSYNSGTGALVANCTRMESQISSWDLVSASTNTIGTGAKTFVTYNGKSALLATSDTIIVSRRSTNAGNRFYGTVTSYNNADGTLVINCTSTIGSGTSLTDWIIVSGGTFSAWKIVPSPITNITLTGNAVLTFDQEPSYPIGSLVSLDRGRFHFANASTTTPWVIESATRGTNSAKIFQLENNGKATSTTARIQVATGSGAAGQTIDLSGVTYAKIDFPAIEVETGSGTGVYRPWYVLEDGATDRGYLGKNWVSRGYKSTLDTSRSSTVTLTTATPTVITWNSHGLRPGQRVRFTTTGTYTGITTGTDYYVQVANFTANAFSIATSPIPASLIAVSAQSGTHTCTVIPEFGSGICGNVLLWNPTTRILKCGNGTVGNVIPSGAKVRIPNVHFTQDVGRAPIMSAISSATAGNAVTFTIGAGANIGTSTGTFFINGEEFTGTFSGTTITSTARALNGTIAANHAQGDTFYCAIGATSNTGNTRGLVDLADGGILELNGVSFGNVYFLMAGSQDSTLTDVWTTGGPNIGSTTGNITINGLYNSPWPQSDGTATTVTSVLGTLNATKIYGATTACVQNASPQVTLITNNQNVASLSSIEGLSTMRNGTGQSRSVDLTANVYSCMPSDLRVIGGRLFLSNKSRFEIDGVILAHETNGISSSNAATTAVFFVNCQYAILRNVTKFGGACRNQVFYTDPNCSNIKIHSVTYDCDSNSSAVLAPSGNNILLANGTFGAPRDGSGTGGGAWALTNNSTGDTVTVRNCTMTIGDTYGADNGIGETARVFIEQSSGHSMWWRAAGTPFAGNFQEMGPFHTLLDNGTKATGTLFAQFSSKSTRDIYTLNGSAYLNNGGSVFLPVTGDYIILKSYQNIRTVTGFTGVVDPEDVNTANLTYEFELVGAESSFTNSFTSLTTANLNTAIAAISGYDDSKGFKIQVKIAAIADSATNQVINLRMFTTNNASTVLPIDYVNYTVSNLAADTTFAAFDGSTEVAYTSGVSTSATLKLPYAYDGNTKTDAIKVRNLQYTWADHNTTFNQYDYSYVGTQVVDSQVTETNKATVAAYTDLGTTSKIYDYSKYWGMQRANLLVSQVCTKSGTALDFGSYNLVFDASAASVFSVSGSTITIKASVVSGGTIKTTGTVSYLNGATAIVPITSSAGTTGVITLTVPSGASVVVYKSDGSRDQYVASSSGTVTSYVPAGVTGSRTYKVSQYGKTTVTGSIVVTGGGYFAATVTNATDAGITEATVGTVSAYTTLETLAKLYDYAAYYETTTAGIDYARVANKTGAAVDLLTKSLTIDATAGSVWAYNGTTATIKASALADGGPFTSLTTSGAVSYANGATFATIITDSTGTTGIFTLSGLSSHNVYLENGSGVQQDYQTGVSSFVAYIAAGITGTYRWRAVKYGNVPETGTFLATGGGRFSDTLSNVADTAISQPTLATVLSYTTLETWDKVYDYCQAYLTTSNGKTLGQFATKNGSAVDLGSYALTVDSAAGSVFALSSGITIKATTLDAGSVFAGGITSGAVSTAGSAVINTWYTSAAGRSVLILAPNIMMDSRAWLYNQTTAATIDNSLVGASGVRVRLIWTSDATVKLTATCLSCVPLVTTGVLTNTGLTFLSSQTTDSVYTANAIDGTTCDSSNGGEFTADLPNVQIDINDADNTTTLSRAYAWSKYYETTAAGIVSFLNCITATDTASYFIDGTIVDIAFDNKKSALLTIGGGFITKTGGTSLVASTTTGSIYFNSGKAYVASSDLLAKEASVQLAIALSA